MREGAREIFWSRNRFFHTIFDVVTFPPVIADSGYMALIHDLVTFPDRMVIERSEYDGKFLITRTGKKLEVGEWKIELSCLYEWCWVYEWEEYEELLKKVTPFLGRAMGELKKGNCVSPKVMEVFREIAG